MELKAKVITLLPIVTGQGKNGEWKKQEFVVEIPAEQYPKKVCLSLWGDKIPCPQIGETVTIQFDVESREYNGRWFTECKAWKIEVNSQTTKSDHPSGQTEQLPPHLTPQTAQQQFNSAPVENDLPF